MRPGQEAPDDQYYAEWQTPYQIEASMRPGQEAPDDQNREASLSAPVSALQ